MINLSFVPQAEYIRGWLIKNVTEHILLLSAALVFAKSHDFASVEGCKNLL